jgi:hypothetical protein
MFMQHKRKERIMLKNRKGFVRIAVEQVSHREMQAAFLSTLTTMS